MTFNVVCQARCILLDDTWPELAQVCGVRFHCLLALIDKADGLVTAILDDLRIGMVDWR